MDVLDYLSDQEENEYHQESSDGVNNTPSTDLSKSFVPKTKTIKKKYEPIQDCNKVYRYEDDPEEYKRARKKVQNR